MYLPLGKVADTSFHIQGDGYLMFLAVQPLHSGCKGTKCELFSSTALWCSIVGCAYLHALQNQVNKYNNYRNEIQIKECWLNMIKAEAIPTFKYFLLCTQCSVGCLYSANTIRLHNAAPMLARRHRLWASIKPALTY